MLIERLFLGGLSKRGLGEFSLSRNRYGVLIASHASPCEEIGSVSVYIQPWEITISSQIIHTHVGRTDFYPRAHERTLTNLAYKRLIARGALDKLQSLVSGRIVLSRTESLTGQALSSGWGPIETEDRARDLRQLEELYGQPVVLRQWTWFGAFPAVAKEWA